MDLKVALLLTPGLLDKERLWHSQGLIADHLKSLLEHGVCSDLLGELTHFVRGKIPEEIIDGIRMVE